MDDIAKNTFIYITTQGPWAVVCAVMFYVGYKLLIGVVNKIVPVIERNTEALARNTATNERVIQVMDKIREIP